MCQGRGIFPGGTIWLGLFPFVTLDGRSGKRFPGAKKFFVDGRAAGAGKPPLTAGGIFDTIKDTKLIRLIKDV